AVVLGAGGVTRDRAAGGAELGLVVAGEVRRERLPGGALVRGAEDVVTAGIEHVGVVRRDQDRVGPLEAVLEVLGAVAAVHLRPDGDDARLAGAVVVAQHHAAAAGRAAHGAGVDDVGVVRSHLDVTALGATHGVALPPWDGAAGRGAGNADGGVILLGA